MVKKLRDETQLPMMDCKNALVDAGGDYELAKQKLRESGKKFMGARADRGTEEGRIAVYSSLKPGVGAIIELQVESAPVAKNEEVIQLANDLAKQLASGPGAKTPDELWDQPSPSQPKKTLRDAKDELENKIREVFRLARIARIDAPTGSYVHHDAKSGVLLQIEGGNEQLAREIAMHVAAMKPNAVSVEDLDPAVVEKERSILMEAARQEGKPENILAKMVEGRLRNFYAETVLAEQAFVKDEKQTVGKVAVAAGMKLKKFLHWRLGGSSGS